MANTPLGAVLRHIRLIACEKAYKDASDCELIKGFLVQKDEAAFVALLKRHGPMVFKVCRRIQGNEHDAEDTFQATFLLLARKANSIRRRESVASWLYGVAYRLAVERKCQKTKRQQRERQAADMRPTSRDSDQAWQELEIALHQALQQVSEKYRAPLLLCYFEGKTQEEAAKQLGCPLGTVRSRLARGRDRLKELLLRHGVPLSATALAAVLAGNSASPAVRPTLLRATAKAAIDYAAGRAAAAVVSAIVAALVEKGLKTMLTTKLKGAVAVAVMMIGTLGLGAGGVRALAPAGSAHVAGQANLLKAFNAVQMARRTAGFQPAKSPAGPTTKAQLADEKDSAAYSGRLVGPDGRPVSGAKVYLTRGWRDLKEPYSSPQYATTGRDGSFSFTVSKAKNRDYGATIVAAGALPYGVGWMTVQKNPKSDNLAVELARHVPIVGQVFDLEAKPIIGATLTVHQNNAPDGVDFGPWLNAIKAKDGPSIRREPECFQQFTIGLSPKVTTDAEGRFQLGGIGIAATLQNETPGGLDDNKMPDHTKVAARSPELTFTRIEFREHMYSKQLNDTTCATTFRGNVFAMRMAAAGLDAMPEADKPPKDALLMKCSVLTVLERKLPDGKKLQQMVAKEHVYCQMNDMRANAEEVTFDKNQDTMVLKGSPANPAVVWRQVDGPGSQWQTTQALVIIYNRKSKTVRVDTADHIGVHFGPAARK